MNVSSMVVQARSEYIEGLVEIFKNCDFCDYHFHNTSKGKIIVTVEGEGIAQEMENVKKIEEIPHVITAQMMMSYSEDELDQERDKLQKSDMVPEILTKEDIKLRDIVYHGDLKKKL